MTIKIMEDVLLLFTPLQKRKCYSSRVRSEERFLRSKTSSIAWNSYYKRSIKP